MPKNASFVNRIDLLSRARLARTSRAEMAGPGSPILPPDCFEMFKMVCRSRDNRHWSGRDGHTGRLVGNQRTDRGTMRALRPVSTDEHDTSARDGVTHEEGSTVVRAKSSSGASPGAGPTDTTRRLTVVPVSLHLRAATNTPLPSSAPPVALAYTMPWRRCVLCLLQKVGIYNYVLPEPGRHARQAAGQVSPSGRDRTLSQSVRPVPHVQSAVSSGTAVVGGA